jgi:hypothetical protein
MMVFFFQKNPQFSVRLGQTALRNFTKFKYLGIIFDRKLTWRLHAEYIQRRCHATVNFIKSIAGQSWGAHPTCLLRLYKSTVRSVIEYGGVCFSGMSDCHMRRLEQIQWRAGRICFGLLRDGWMDVSGWSSTPARGAQDGPNVHHGFIFDVTITYFCIQPGFTDETISVLHVFGF